MLNAQTTAISDNDQLLLSFLNQFVNTDFIEDIIHVVVFDADADSVIKKHSEQNTLEIIDTFLDNITKDFDKLKLINGQYKQIRLNINCAKKLVQLKQNIGGRIINYNSLNESFLKNNIGLTALITKILQNQLQTIEQFKEKLNSVLEKIRIGNEVREIKKSLLKLDEIKEKLKSPDCNLLDILLDYRNTIDLAANEVTKIKSINITESLSNSIFIGGLNYTPGAIVDNTVKYLGSGYAFYKSGYDLIDTSIGGLEAANLHLICGPSNNAKSIFMINLLRMMALNNKQEFEPNDLMLYITLEDK